MLAVHAHPDDEASKGSGTTARYSHEGIRAVLVCCTGGEEGEILNPEFERTSEVDLVAIRHAELQESAAIIGYAAIHELGYRDSGMAGTAANDDPTNFANAPFDEAVGRLVAIIRTERPQVVVGYGEEQSFYPHPDHVRVHEVTRAAFDAAGDPAAFPDAGPPWKAVKLYSVGYSLAHVEALHAAFERVGQDSPYASWFERGFGAGVPIFTTFVDVGDFLDRRRAALLAHRTQVDPSGHWMRLTDDQLREAFPWEEYVLEMSHVPVPQGEGMREDDLFAGVRVSEPRS